MIDFRPDIRKQIDQRLLKQEQSLSPHACQSGQAQRLVATAEDIRPPFFHDADKIIYSQAYTRYIDKTQVFYLVENDHITHRVLHVQLVAKIARTIGRFLSLNEDLLEAISLGHDVGHTPFGHNGESIISAFCQQHDCGIFEHNVQSFRLFHELECGGKGTNLTMQTLDGIICHNGEVLNPRYDFDPHKNAQQLLDSYHDSLKVKGVSEQMKPMTLEGCVMRISDIIAYVGRDIEDAITLKLISRDDLPHEATEVIGNQNREIVNNLIVDLVNNSFGQPYLRFSDDVFAALQLLQKWNYEHIYNNPRKTTQDKKIQNIFNAVLEACLNDLDTAENTTGIGLYLQNMAEPYRENTSHARIVADYVSGMTDDFLMNTFKQITLPRSFGLDFRNV